MQFKGKVILVTGASRGIGAAIAKAFATEGGTVAVNYLQNAQAAEAVVNDCRQAGGDAWAIQADVSSEPAVKAMVEQVMNEMGRIDVLVNNAFASYSFDPEQRSMFWETSWADYQRQLDGALKSTFGVCQAVLPHFRKRSSGAIVNMVSDLVERPTVPYHDYTTAKSALIGFSRNLAAELGPLGIRVNCVAPGLVYPTAASRQTREEVKDMITAQTPLRRIANPGDVAGPVLFLASDWSRFMTGQTLFVDGGLVMK
ncbi:MAG: 3-oxoacyl-ACP reductase [Gammaproteobacteria bacterium]|nr:3-oxoacyl-ACP reductase [Gammaproteobacteria bacterium]MBU0788642.1 3-oxoacyl-ACP reductase [Gammaproteobacteria bacterium]MBU0814739.1 3-oxoacyl-ACP reductase [Gammaproteobacteria bacterium]MBU1786418.1 3-oxoacyl-ACP reductase [Gammaproteobacteria bacterium]